MLDPRIFRLAKRSLHFKPGVDLFASMEHHQLPRYYAVDADPGSAGKDAFRANWLLEVRPYCNPPWFLIPRCLTKIIKDQAEVMMVVPKWEHAKWWPAFKALCRRFIDLDEAIYLKADGTLWDKPAWDTRIGVLDGTRRVPF